MAPLFRYYLFQENKIFSLLCYLQLPWKIKFWSTAKVTKCKNNQIWHFGPLWQCMYIDKHEKVQGCVARFWFLYGTLKQPNFTSYTDKWVFWSAHNCFLKIFTIQFNLKVAYCIKLTLSVSHLSNLPKIDQPLCL